MATNPTTGMEDLTEVNKLTGAFPAAQKGYIGPKELAPALKEVSQKEAVAQEELAKSDIRVEKAKREEEATKAEKMKGFYEGEKKALEELPERATYKQSVEELNAAKFEPTKDTMKDIAGLFSLVGVVGMVLGKSNATQAMYAMNGMMEGHIKGRKDLVKQQAIEFEKNFKALQTKVDASYKELQDAVSLRMYDQKAGQEAITMAIARSESPLLKEMEARQGPMRTLAFLKDVKDNTLGNMVKLNNDLRAKADDRALREQVAELKAAASGKATQQQMMAQRAVNSLGGVASALESIKELPAGTTTGLLPNLQTKDGMINYVRNTVGRKVSSRDAEIMNTLFTGIGRNLASIEASGAATGLSELSKQMQSGVYINSGVDDPYKVAIKLADIKRIATENIRPAIESGLMPEGQARTAQALVERIEKAIPFNTIDVIQASSKGKPTIRESTETAVSKGKPSSWSDADEKRLQELEEKSRGAK
jgi:hypothetical protein